MSDSGLGRFAPLTGPLFVLLAVGSFAAFGDDPPDIDDSSAAELVRFWADGGDSMMIAVFLQAFACISLVWFGGCLYRAFRATEKVPFLSIVAFGGTLALAIGLAVDASVTLTLQQTADDIHPAAVQALSAFYDNDFVPMAVGTAVFLLASGLAIVRTGVLPKWLGWIALLLFVIAATPAGFFAFLGGGLWLAVTGILLTLQAGKPAPTAG